MTTTVKGSKFSRVYDFDNLKLTNMKTIYLKVWLFTNHKKESYYITDDNKVVVIKNSVLYDTNEFGKISTSYRMTKIKLEFINQ